MSIRPVKMQSEARPTTEGAGVHLHRVFGFGDTTPFDPFLMMDDFRNDDPQLYQNGFPWHPHRGIETITYVLKGTVDHADSLGNVGTLGGGDIQWMTAGSGIIHQEMPHGDAQGAMHGFQLWANLPSSQKMTTPRYQDIKSAEISELHDDDDSKIRVIAGNYRGYGGPVDGIAADPQYLDITLPPRCFKKFPFDTRRQAASSDRVDQNTAVRAAQPTRRGFQRVTRRSSHCLVQLSSKRPSQRCHPAVGWAIPSSIDQ